MSSNPVIPSLLSRWLTVKLLAQTEPSFTESAIRYLIFNAAPRHTSRGPIPGNGLSTHIRRVGSKVLIDHEGFLSWIDGHENHVQSVIQSKNPHKTRAAAPAVTINNKVTGSPATSPDPSSPGKHDVQPKLRSKQHSRRRK